MVSCTWCKLHLFQIYPDHHEFGPDIDNDSCRLSTYEQVWDGIYDMDKGPASLNYLSLGAGFIVGLQISHPVMDKVLKQPHLVVQTEIMLIDNSCTHTTNTATTPPTAYQSGASHP